MSSRLGAAERTLRLCLGIGFWLPLAGCTWLALTPTPPDAVFRFGDVVLHAAAFAYLTFALGLAYPALRWRAPASSMLGYGVLIELVQSFEPARSAELKDLLVDTAGITVGLVLLVAVGAWSRRTLLAIVEAALPSPRG